MSEISSCADGVEQEAATAGCLKTVRACAHRPFDFNNFHLAGAVFNNRTAAVALRSGLGVGTTDADALPFVRFESRQDMVGPAVSTSPASTRLRRWLGAAAIGASPSAGLATGLLFSATSAHAKTRLLNAAVDGPAPLFEQIDRAFTADYKKQTGRDVRVEIKAAPAAAQVQAVQDGLAPDWRTKFPQQAALWDTTVLLVVRAGNPKRSRDWTDLARPGVCVLLPDPALDSVLLEYPVAIVERTTRKKGSGELAEACLNFLFSPPVQALTKAHGLRALASDRPIKAADARPSRKPTAAADQENRLLAVPAWFGSLRAAEQQQFGPDGWLARLNAKPQR